MSQKSSFEREVMCLKEELNVMHKVLINANNNISNSINN